jgi:hypothetical protein
VGRRANPLPRPAGGMSTAACPALTVPPETAQEPTGERKDIPATMGDTPAVEERCGGCSGCEHAATGGPREPGQRRGGERTAAACATQLQRGPPSLP